MTFIIDQHTQHDLQIFGEIDYQSGQPSNILELFGKTQSFGGQKHVRWILNHPSSNVKIINHRLRIIKCFTALPTYLIIEQPLMEKIDYYLKISYSIFPTRFYEVWKQKILYFWEASSEVYNIYYGVSSFLKVLGQLRNYLVHLENRDLPEDFNADIVRAITILKEKRLSKLIDEGSSYGFWQCVQLDQVFRRGQYEDMLFLIQLIHQIDAYQAIAKVAETHHFSIPTVSDHSSKLLFKGLFHPLLESPVANNFDFLDEQSLCLLSGPNMAGKSTFLKSIGIAVYLAHCGLPVPATNMDTCIYQGLITTINLDDNLLKGHSHYYSEVDRLKTVVNTMSTHPKIVVIFDELFRGTNVKDANEGTFLVADEFSNLKHSKVFISTHISEAIEKLHNIKSNLSLKYFEAKLENKNFTYDFKIKNGYSDQRLGLEIIKKEGILEGLKRLR